MKKIIFLLLFVFFCFSVSAQKQYSVNGESFKLKTEVNGTINLLWTLIDRKYRYFVEKDGTIIELVNTKNDNKKFQEEYKVVLNNLTKGSGLSTEKVKLTLYSLRNFINGYNSSKNPNYIPANDAVVQSLLLIFGGITNNPFTENTSNTNNMLIGFEIEVFEASNLPRHSIYLEFQQRFQSNAYKYSLTQFGIGYRFRFLNKKRFSIYANIMAATYSFTKQTISFLEDDVLIEQEVSENGFNAPFIFGVGVDFRATDHSFITLTYNDLFALLLDNNGDFSTSFSLGYKFKL